MHSVSHRILSILNVVGFIAVYRTLQLRSQALQYGSGSVSVQHYRILVQDTTGYRIR